MVFLHGIGHALYHEDNLFLIGWTNSSHKWWSKTYVHGRKTLVEFSKWLVCVLQNCVDVGDQALHRGIIKRHLANPIENSCTGWERMPRSHRWTDLYV